MLAFCAGGAAARQSRARGKACSADRQAEEGEERGGRDGGHLGSVCDTFNVVGSGEGSSGDGDGEAAEARQVSERREGGTGGRFRQISHREFIFEESQMALCLLDMTQANNMPNSQHMNMHA